MPAATFMSSVLAFAVALPIATLAVLAAAMLIGHRPSERRVHQLVALCLSASLVLAFLLALSTWTGIVPAAEVDLGTLVAVRGYHFDLALRADALGATFLLLDMLLCGLVGAFSAPYLHQDEGFYRFYVLMMAFVVGIALIATGSGLDLLFAGWEIVGLSSGLLIAFFFRRTAPVENGLRAYAVYRVTDVGLLLAVVALHHQVGTTALERLAEVDGAMALVIGGLLVFGAMGKGAMVPFTPWLPRAMEGPTPSSAVFYGALSIHASPFLLLRIEPLLASPGLSVVVFGIGALTAFHATMVGRVQTDVKTSLGYASVAQVGVIWMWIGLGWYRLALLHVVGHAVLRTWQLLRAPSLLHDRHRLVQVLGTDIAPTGRHLAAVVPDGFRMWTYRIALERWYLDELWDGLVKTVVAALQALDGLDRRWAALLREEFVDRSTDLEVELLEVGGK